VSYYTGDFYQGDPGFMSFLGRAAGFIPGIGGTLSKIVTKIGSSRAGKFVAQHPTLTAAATSGIAGAGTGMMLRPSGGTPMMMGGTPAALGFRTMAPGPAGPSARGYHMSKPRRGVPPHLVRNRRMRVTNPRALRRAIRRARGFERLARKVMHFVSPRAHKGRAVFRARRRK